VVSGISIDKTSVYVGDTVAVTGTGFAANENNIFVTLSGVKQGDAVTTDANGLWHSTFTVPETVNGSHVIDAYGGITTAASITDKNLTVMCKVSLSPLAGNVGDTVTVKGSGFSGSRTITVQFGTIQVISELSTGENGSFLTTFKVPKTTGGNIEVVVKDAANISSGAMFELDKTPPSVPRIKSPISNKAMGIIGDTRVDFFWNEVMDPSGVTYDMQVATDIDFNGVVMEQTELAAPEYRSFDDEKLPEGPYYWRVRAIDYASNASAWSTPAQFKVGLVSLTTLLIIVAVLVVVILISARASAVFKSKKD
ncbi:MAG TPA: IPT/TIG domain-containing protein, partial [Dehalococcoidia bacterium]|nr:IPT/TIG domain-containing protein [Dehalococcoidia bacterium]